MASSKERRRMFETNNKDGLESKKVVLDMGRRILAYEMATSGKEIPPVCFNYEPDVTALMERFKSLKQNSGLTISLNTLVMRCVVEGLKKAPVLNSHLDYKYMSARGTLTMYDHININMPTILPDGSMQAVNIKKAESMTLKELDVAVNNLMEMLDDPLLFGHAQVSLAIEQTMRFIKRGRLATGVTRLFWAVCGKERIKVAGHDNLIKLAVASEKRKKEVESNRIIHKSDLEEGTVMVTNIGSLYKEMSGNVTMFEIIPPEIFAVALGSIQRRAVVRTDDDGNEVIKPATILPMALVFDHKAVDFGDIIPFIKRIDNICANPQEIDSWL